MVFYLPLFRQWKMKAKSNDLYITPPLSLQGEFAGLVDSLQVQPFQG
jgi:hypothetical protein